MNSGRTWRGLEVALLFLAPIALHANEKAAIPGSLVKKGEAPPGSASVLSISQARAALKGAINKRYIGTVKCCQRVLMIKGCYTLVLPEATVDVKIRAAGFDFEAPHSSKITGIALRPDESKVSVEFKKDQDYIRAFRVGLGDSKSTWSPNPLYSVGYLPNPERSPMEGDIFYWSEEAPAQEFADAFNRLLYAAYRDEEFVSFIAAAQAWRENAVKPPLSPEADRHRILAENAFQEKNLDSAIEHYETALEIQPMWPEGWFNLALMYAELKNYVDASDRMKHYLALVPNARDANDARTQMIIWEDKAAKH